MFSNSWLQTTPTPCGQDQAERLKSVLCAVPSACFGIPQAGITVLKVRIPPETSDVVAKAHRVFLSVSATHFQQSADFQIVSNASCTDRSTVDTTSPELLPASLNKPQKIKRPLHPSPLIAVCFIHPDEGGYIASRNAGSASYFKPVNPGG